MGVWGDDDSARSILPLQVFLENTELNMFRVLGRGSRLAVTSLSPLLVGALVLGQTANAHAEETVTESAEAAPAADGPNEEELATARLHFANGVELLQDSSPNYQDAFRQFQLAYNLTHGSWKVMGNLGLCALKLERDGEALGYYEGYLAKGGEDIDPEERSHIEREMLLIKGNMATAQITSSAPGVRISVSRQGSPVPPQIYETDSSELELGLRGGTLKLTATNEAGKSLTWEATIAAGESASHHFDFDAKDEPAPAAATAASAPAAAPAPEKKGLSGLQIGGIAAAGLGVGALGGGVALGLLSQGTEKEALDDCFNEICAEDTKGDFDKAKNQAKVANILFITGGVLAAAGVTLIVIGSTSDSGPQDSALLHTPASKPSPFTLQLSPMAQPGGGGVFAFGSF